MARFMDDYKIDWTAITEQDYASLAAKKNGEITLPIKMNGSGSAEYRLCIQTKHRNYEDAHLVAEVKTRYDYKFTALEDFKPNENDASRKYDTFLALDGVISIFNDPPASFQEFKNEVDKHFEEEFGMTQFVKQLQELAACCDETEMHEFFGYYTYDVPVLAKVNIDEFKELFVNGDASARAFAATRGWGTDTLVNDENFYVRYSLAECGYCLDSLITDESETVSRCAAQRIMYNYNHGVIDKIDEDVFINSPHETVREIAANNGIALETLLSDESENVRRCVAQQGYGLDTLVDDASSKVRIAVAQQGVGLSRLIADEDIAVRTAAEEFLAEQNKNGALREEKPVLNQNQSLDWAALPENTYYNIQNDTHILSGNVFIPIVENGEAVKNVKAQLSCVKYDASHSALVMKIVDNHCNELPAKLGKDMPRGVIGRFNDAQLGTYENFIETINNNFKAFVQQTFQKNKAAVERG